MKEIKEIVKTIPAFILFPIADPISFLKLLFLIIFLAIVLCIPIIVIGLLLGIGVQLASYISGLYKQASSDTKIIVIVGIIGSVVGAIAVLPIISSVFKKLRNFSWDLLEKNKIHFRGAGLFATPVNKQISSNQESPSSKLE